MIVEIIVSQCVIYGYVYRMPIGLPFAVAEKGSTKKKDGWRGKEELRKVLPRLAEGVLSMGYICFLRV